MGLMSGKRGLIMGLANDKSIAWGIAKAVAAEGGELAFSIRVNNFSSGLHLWPRNWAAIWSFPVM